MSLNFYLPTINPIPYSHPKLQFTSNPTSCRPNRTGPSRRISPYTCHREPCNLIGGSIVAKAVKTDGNEVSSFADEEITVDFDWDDVEDDEEALWEGAIVYRRNSSVTHVEYCTTLERLGLDKLSSELSISRASAMGLRVTKAVKDYSDGTPVLISIDVTRTKQKLRLDGIIKTVITLACNRVSSTLPALSGFVHEMTLHLSLFLGFSAGRGPHFTLFPSPELENFNFTCGEPAPESIFTNFSLLLTEEPIEEPEVVNMGTIYGDNRSVGVGGTADHEEDVAEALIDLEDRLYFPPEEKEIDISKHIRDLVHLEITINAVCDPKCQGLCLRCGTNLNTSVCNCSEDVDDGSCGPLGNLKKQMQQK